MTGTCPRCGALLDPDASCFACGDAFSSAQENASAPAYDPRPLPADGDRDGLLDEVYKFLRAYVAFPSAAAAVAVTLWAVHTHLVAQFESTPRLALLSPEKHAASPGARAAGAALRRGGNPLGRLAAYLYRRIGAGEVTILLDEADAIWKRGKSDETAEALRSIVNAGHRRSPRSAGWR